MLCMNHVRLIKQTNRLGVKGDNYNQTPPVRDLVCTLILRLQAHNYESECNTRVVDYLHIQTRKSEKIGRYYNMYLSKYTLTFHNEKPPFIYIGHLSGHAACVNRYMRYCTLLIKYYILFNIMSVRSIPPDNTWHTCGTMPWHVESHLLIVDQTV